MTAKSLPIRYIVFFLIITSYGEFSQAQEIKNVNGVLEITNQKDGKWDNDSAAKINLVRVLGMDDGGDENAMFYMPEDIVMDSEGNYYVLDSGNFAIKKFNDAGEFILAIGEKGQGPGEFIIPFSLDIDKHDKLYASDIGNSLIHIFSVNGILEKSMRLNGKLDKLRLLNDGRYAVNMKSGGAGGTGFFVPGRGFDFNSPKGTNYQTLKESLIHIYDQLGDLTLEIGNTLAFSDFRT